MVPGAGVEPARGFPRGIFIPSTAFAAALLKTHLWPGLSLYPIIANYDLGRSRQVSTLSLESI
jgi:hypothetical protein